LIAILLLRTSQSPLPVYMAGALGFCLGIILFVRGFRLLQRRRLILDTPFSKIRSASMGMVEVSGQAVGPYTMIAPITARPCYYYRTVIWELKKQGKNSQWVKIAGECMHLPFFVDDNTGRPMVDPRGAELDLHRDFEQQFCDSFFTTKDPAPPNVVSFLARHGVVTNNKIKVEEYCIKPKNALFVLGTLAENPGIEVTSQPIHDPEPVISTTTLRSGFAMTISFDRSADNDINTTAFSQRVATPAAGRQEVIHLSPQPAPIKTADMTQQQKIAAALVKAGISNPAAWAVAGMPLPGLSTPGVQVIADPQAAVLSDNVNASNGSDAEHPDGNGNGNGSNGQTTAAPDSHQRNSAPPSGDFVLHPPVILMKGSNNQAFLISWRSQQEVARALGWKCALMIWGGPALALLCLYLVLKVAHLI
jgi:hypothetical protein